MNKKNKTKRYIRISQVQPQYGDSLWYPTLNTDFIDQFFKVFFFREKKSRNFLRPKFVKSGHPLPVRTPWEMIRKKATRKNTGHGKEGGLWLEVG